jgi:hypothetical protein
MKKLLIILACIAGTPSMQAQGVNKTDSTQIRTTIFSFYNWYLKNNSRINSFNLYSGVRSNDTPPYHINWKEDEKYFAYIRSSVPQLGEEYIRNQKIFLKQCDSAFKADTEGDVPYGFDWDWYTDSQEEPSYLVDELKKAKQWVMNVKGVDATVDLLSYYMDKNKKVETVIMCFAMKKEKGKWKIAKIGCAYKED